MKRRTGSARKGAPAFDAFYRGVFAERWVPLRCALLSEKLYARLRVKDAPAPPPESAARRAREVAGAQPEGALAPYFMDAASVVCALCLPVRGRKSALDLCAAPGGKSLVLRTCMDGGATLFCNDVSPARHSRMVNTLRACLGEDGVRNIRFSLSDGALWCKATVARFESILIDCPCSSERHVLADAKYLAQWTPARVRSLSFRQFSLLSSAYRLLEDGGALLYATCALCDAENDFVVEKLKKRFPSATVERALESIFAENAAVLRERAAVECAVPLEEIFSARERTRNGFRILPDTARGAGPIYFSLLRKHE